MSTEIQCFNPCESMDRMKAVEALGEFIARSGMTGCETKEQGIVVAFTCAMEGIHPIEFGRRYHIIKGTPSMRADRMAAEFRSRGGKYEIKELTREACEVEFTFDKQKHSVRLTFEDAKKAGWAIDKKNGGISAQWKQTPDDMLFSRVISRGVKRLCPEVVAGLSTPEEIADFVEVDTKATTPKAPPMVAKQPAPEPPAAPSTPEPEQSSDIIDGELVEEIDYNICPVPGKAFGTHWNEWSEKAMDALCGSKDAPRIADSMTQAHWDAMQKIREARP